MIICDPVTLSLIFICLVTIFYKKKKMCAVKTLKERGVMGKKL